MQSKMLTVNKKDFFSILVGLFLLIILQILYLIVPDNSKPQICIIIATITALYFSIKSLKDFKNRYILFCFDLTYFLFLISGLLINIYSYSAMKAYLAVSDEAIIHTCLCIAVSLITINIVYFLLKTPKSLKQSEKTENHYQEINSLKQIITILFFVSMIGKFVESLMIFSLSSSLGYSESYTISVKLPVYLSAPSAAFYLLFCLWLSMKPKKKEFVFPIIVVLIIETLILFSGDRSEPMSVILMLSYYLFVRRNNEDFYKIRKKQIVLIVIASICFIYLLQYISFSRDHNEMTVTNNFIFDFFNKQGISAAVIGKGYDLKEQIAGIGGHHYSLGALLNYLSQNVISRMLFGIDRIKLNSVEAATSGNSYGSTMAYIRFKSSYLSGVGCGTSFVAELYHDGGMLLLIIGSALIAVLLHYIYVNKINRVVHRTYITEAIALLIFKNIITLPRNGCFSWLASSFSVQNILILGVIVIIQNNCKKHKRIG